MVIQGPRVPASPQPSSPHGMSRDKHLSPTVSSTELLTFPLRTFVPSQFGTVPSSCGSVHSHGATPDSSSSCSPTQSTSKTYGSTATLDPELNHVSPPLLRRDRVPATAASRFSPVLSTKRTNWSPCPSPFCITSSPRQVLSTL